MVLAKDFNWKIEFVNGELRPTTKIEGDRYVPSQFQRLAKSPKAKLWNEEIKREFPLSDKNVILDFTVENSTGWRTGPIQMRDYHFVIPEETELIPL